MSIYQQANSATRDYDKFMRDTRMYRRLTEQIRVLVRFLQMQSIAALCGFAAVLPVLDGFRLIMMLALLQALTGESTSEGMGDSLTLFQWQIPVPFISPPYGRDDLLYIVLGLTLITLAQSAVQWWSKRIAVRTQHYFMEGMREAMIDKLFSLNMSFFNKVRSGELIYMMNAEIGRTSVIVPVLVEFASTLLSAVFVSAMLVSMSLEVTVGLFLVGGALHLVQHVFILRLRPISLALTQISNQGAGVFQEMLYGIRLVRMMGLEAREKGKYLAIHQSNLPNLVKQEGLNEGIKAIGSLGLVVVLLGVFFVAGSFTDGADLGDPGLMLAYLFLVTRLYPILSGLNDLKVRMAYMYGPMVRTMGFIEDDRFELPNRKPTGNTVAPIPVGDLTVANVCFAYEPDQPVLQDISLTCKVGCATVIVGLSGSGKSTLFDLISGLRVPEAGEIYFGEYAMGGLDSSAYRSSIGYVGQESIIFHDTLLDNIRYARPEASEQEVVEAARLAQAHDFIVQMPDGYDSIVGERGSSLSGGQRQRIALARVLLQKPEVILLDEATSSLDLLTEAAIYKVLMELKENKVILVAAHRLSAITSFDHIIVMHKGRVLEQGTHVELMAGGGLYSNLFRVQEYASDIDISTFAASIE